MKKFLVIQQKMIGDVLMSTIICDSLKQKFPDCQIDFVANENTLAVLEHHPSIDKIIVFKNEYRQKTRLYHFLKEISKTHYDAVIDAYGKLESNLISKFSDSKVKISYEKWYTKWIYTQVYQRFTKPDSNERLAVKNRLLLLKYFDLNENQLIKNPKIYLTEEERTKAIQFLNKNGITNFDNLYMISVLGSSEDKTYPAAYMAQTINEICEINPESTFLFNYIPKQEKEARNIYNLCNQQTQSRIKFDVFSNSLRGFLGILEQCKALIGNEGGAVNMAKALGVPTFCIFAPFTGKAGWSVASEKNHVGVHLLDYDPKLSQLSKKKIRKNRDQYYHQLTPDLFEKQLVNFINRVL